MRCAVLSPGVGSKWPMATSSGAVLAAMVAASTAPPSTAEMAPTTGAGAGSGGKPGGETK